MVFGSALWSFVIGGMAGLAWSLLDDRERYRMLKYLYLSPNTLLVLLLGRGAARLAIAAMGALITLGVGVVFLGVGFDITRVDWLLLIPSLALGFIAIVVARDRAGGHLHADAAGIVVVPGGSGGRDVPDRRRGLSAGRAAAGRAGRRATSCRSPGGSRACVRHSCPGSLSGDRRPGLARGRS